MEENAVNKLERKLKISIPVENVNKAIMVLNYFKEVDLISSQVDTKKALREMENVMHGGVSLGGHDLFSVWSAIYQILNLHRRRKFLELIKLLIAKAMNTPGQEEAVDSLFYLMCTHQYNTEALSMLPMLIEYANETNYINLIYSIENWLKEKAKIVENTVAGDFLDKLFFVRMSVLKNKKDLNELLSELNRKNDDARVEALCLTFGDTIKSLTQKELIGKVSITKDFFVGGIDETVAIFSLIELIERHK